MRIEVETTVQRGFPIIAVVHVSIRMWGPAEDCYIEEILNPKGRPITFLKLTQDEESKILDRAAEIAEGDRSEAKGHRDF